MKASIKPQTKRARIGIVGYAEVLRALYRAPATAKELGDRTDGKVRLRPRGIRILLPRFHALRLVHIVGWRRCRRTIPQAIYAAGEGVNAPPPTRPDGQPYTGRGMVKTAKPTADCIAFATLIRTLATPSSYADMHAETGIGSRSLKKRIPEIKRTGLLFIAEWHRQPAGGNPIPHYQIGVGKSDAGRPKPKDRATIMRRYTEGRKAREQQMRMDRAIAGMQGFAQ